MHLEKSSALIQRLIKKKELLSKKDPAHKDIRTALILPGGCMQGVFGGGVVIGLQLAGFCDVFDVVIGSSCGALNGAYFLSEQTYLGTSIYYEDNVDERFINKRRIKVIDIDYLEEVLRYVKILDTEKIRQSRTKLFAAVMKVSDGSGQLLSVNDGSDMITILKASAAIPAFYNKPVPINGINYMDGGAFLPIPLNKAIISQFKLTDVLIALNKPFGTIEDYSILQRILGTVLMFKFSKQFRSQCFSSQKEYNQTIRDIVGGSFDGLNLGIISPDSNNIYSLTQDPELLKMSALEGATKILKSFEITADVNLLQGEASCLF